MHKFDQKGLRENDRLEVGPSSSRESSIASHPSVFSPEQVSPLPSSASKSTFSVTPSTQGYDPSGKTVSGTTIKVEPTQGLMPQPGDVCRPQDLTASSEDGDMTGASRENYLASHKIPNIQTKPSFWSPGAHIPNLEIPITAPNDPLSMVCLTFRDTARTMLMQGASLDRLNAGGKMCAELLFRNRTPQDEWNIPNWACEVGQPQLPFCAENLTCWYRLRDTFRS